MMSVPGTPQVPVKRMVRIGSRAVGRLTAPARLLPSFLICGGRRCGTTLLHHALAAHPAILAARSWSGTHYFDLNYARGSAWYRASFPLRRDADRIKERFGVLGQTFESGSYYLHHPHAAARIARDLPGARLIVLVRDPVERAYAHHAHEVARGFEMEPDFVRALALEPSRLRGQRAKLLAEPDGYSFSHLHHAYAAFGEYASYLEHLAHQVGRDRLLVLEAERFITDPQPVYDRVLDFLGVPRLGVPEFAPRAASLSPAPIPEEVRAQLRDHFAVHDEALTGWLGRVPCWRE